MTRARRVTVIDIPGLTPRLLDHMPRLAAALPARAVLGTTLPAVTCTAQSTFLTGLTPRDHGIVGNGWYFRELGDIWFWRQHNQLVGGRKLWDHARDQDPEFTVANICWWYAMGADTDWTVTPRPVYHADGRKDPDCYTRPADLHDELTRRFGTFPLFHYWGPRADIRSSRWIARAAAYVLDEKSPTLTLVYLPHLDYDLQRFGPDSPRAAAAARDLDAELAPLLEAIRRSGGRAIAVSEYGITRARQPVDVNRRLREAGLLEVYRQAGMEYLDPWVSRAFAVADHQIAHVYVRDPADVERVRVLLSELAGVGQVVGRDGLADLGLDHERSGVLVLLAARDAWFTYYYWTDDAVAPDFARSVEIHRKPGYDPAELLLDPSDRLAAARAVGALVRKRLGFRYQLRVVGLDPAGIAGTHGLMPASDDEGPVILSSSSLGADRYAATDVMGLILEAAGLRAPRPAD